MSTGDEICRMDATGLARTIAARELSPVEAVDAVLDRLQRLDPTLHMFSTVTPELAREAAKRIEADIAAGREVGRWPACPPA
jgi:aspartyl-tRNA(Asn)/glutamyl-tRNA(Gln) amidotransferase subunit A